MRLAARSRSSKIVRLAAESLIAACSQGMAHAEHAWRSDNRQMPSQYIISIDGEDLTCFLVKKSEAESTDLYAWIKRETKMDVHAVSVAAGHGAAKYAVKVEVISAPMYHKGSLRADGVAALWAECKEACRQKKVFIVRCNQSFHRRPVLLSAMMIMSGMSRSQALEYIATKRTIYSGHFLEHSLWPARERDGEHAGDFLEAHRFFKSLPPICSSQTARGLQPGAAASSLQPTPTQQQADGNIPNLASPKIDSQKSPFPPSVTANTREKEKDTSVEGVSCTDITPAAALGSNTESTPAATTGSQTESATVTAATGAQPESTPATESGSQVESTPAAASGLQPEPAAATHGGTDGTEDNPNWDNDDDKSSVWTDEEEHANWRKMSIADRFKDLRIVKRKLAWYAEQAGADIEGGLQPGARNDKLPQDILDLLHEHQLRHLSHPSAIKGGRLRMWGIVHSMMVHSIMSYPRRSYHIISYR